MGYRSDVAAVFYVSKAEHLPVLKLWLFEHFPMDTFHDNIRWFNRGMIIEDHDTKWYEDYEEVKAFNEAARKYSGLINMGIEHGDNPPQFLYEFVRVGESYDDVETEYEGDNCEFLLGVSREITMEV